MQNRIQGNLPGSMWLPYPCLSAKAPHRPVASAADRTVVDLGEEVVALVVHENECREVFHSNLPYGLHSEFRESDHFLAADVILSKQSCRPSGRPQVKTAVLFAGIGHHLRTVALCQHHHRTSMGLEQIHIAVHPACGGRTKRTRWQPCRCFGWTGVIHREILEILR